MKIGVLSDTHVPDLLPELPARVLEVLSGVDIILHAGDICDMRVLQQLEPIAQTYAVSGNRDGTMVKKYLQETQRLEFANRAIGLVHGHQAWEGSLITRARFVLNPQARVSALYNYVLHQFADVHAIVFGHSHQPYMKMHGGILLFNPGAVSPIPGQAASVGILEIGSNTIKGRIISL
jgi:uncharacterized protein